jgi:alkylation response protein AidB-like acyl-CoA dehydrogenase
MRTQRGIVPAASRPSLAAFATRHRVPTPLDRCAERLSGAHGTRVDTPIRMDENATPTVEMSLEILSEAVGKASDDLRAVRAALDTARADIAARNTSVSRAVLKDAERVIDHLRRADEGLRDVLKDLSERD